MVRHLHLEQEREFLRLRRWEVALFPIEDWCGEFDPAMPARLVPVSTDARLAGAKVFGEHFKFETETDFEPFADTVRAGASSFTYLIDASGIHGSIPYACGAVGVEVLVGRPAVTWVWMHPFERATRPHAWTNVWETLEQMHPGLCLLAPLSKAMRAWNDAQNPPRPVVR